MTYLWQGRLTQWIPVDWDRPSSAVYNSSIFYMPILQARPQDGESKSTAWCPGGSGGIVHWG